MRKIQEGLGVDSDETNLSLAGCGYLGIYHVGVASCIRKYAPYILTQNKMSGASVGALVAAGFTCDVSLEKCASSIFDVSMQVRCGILGPITPDLNIMKILYENMSAILPEDAHLRCNGRLFISVTRYDDCQNVLLSQFDSKEDLLRALMCSCFIPLYCGYEPPEFHGVAYVDGGYSNNSPRLDSHTVIVAPFSGTSGICPRDKSGDFKSFNMNNTNIYISLKNCGRLFRILFPGSADMLQDLCRKGYNDGLLFLRDRGIIKCSECTPEINRNENNNGWAKHKNCKPMEYPLPTEICREIGNVVKTLNQNLGYRLFQNPLLKVLYYANIPSIFTVKMSCALLSVVTKKLQHKASLCMDNVLGDLPQLLSEMLEQTKLKSRFLCHLDFDAVDFDDERFSTDVDNASSHSSSDQETIVNEYEVGCSENSIYGNENMLQAVNKDNVPHSGFSHSEVFRFPSKSPLDVTIQDIRAKEFVVHPCGLSEKTHKCLKNEEDRKRNNNAFVC